MLKKEMEIINKRIDLKEKIKFRQAGFNQYIHGKKLKLDENYCKHVINHNKFDFLQLFAHFKLGTFVLLATLFLSSCATYKYDQSYVSEKIQELSSFSAARNNSSTSFQIPSQVTLEDGITVNEAISIALYNNAQFQADLINITIANADLVIAGQLPNPLLTVIFPTGTDPYKGTLNFAFDALWQRPLRIRAARLESELTAQRLVNTGLQLIRNVRIAYADYMLSDERLLIGRESMRIRAQMVHIIKKQYQEGDISQMEASLAIADSLQAKQEELYAITAEQVARYRLFQLIGLDSANAQFKILPPDTLPQIEFSLQDLLDTAYATRTDLKATALLIEAKGKQLGWERSKIISFIAFLNARNEEDGLALGPAFSLGIPIFNWNRGKILRTRSEMEQATWQYLDVKRNITLEVNQAYAEWKAGRLNYKLWEQNELSLANVTEQVQKAYEAGEVSYYFYLETLRRVIDIQLRAADARAAIYRATANLNYSIGKKQL